MNHLNNFLKPKLQNTRICSFSMFSIIVNELSGLLDYKTFEEVTLDLEKLRYFWHFIWLTRPNHMHCNLVYTISQNLSEYS